MSSALQQGQGFVLLNGLRELDHARHILPVVGQVVVCQAAKGDAETQGLSKGVATSAAANGC